MSNGYWLKRVDGIFATGRKPWSFDTLCRSLPRRGDNPHVREYFIPQNECTDDFKQNNIPVQYLEDDQEEILTQLQNNVDFTDKDTMQSINVQFKKARIDEVLTRTKLGKERLQQRKRQLFYQWSEKFFESFANHFGKLKNCIVQMHLNEQQVNKFNQILESSLSNLKLNLDEIYNQFMEQKQENE